MNLEIHQRGARLHNIVDSVLALDWSGCLGHKLSFTHPN